MHFELEGKLELEDYQEMTKGAMKKIYLYLTLIFVILAIITAFLLHSLLLFVAFIVVICLVMVFYAKRRLMKVLEKYYKTKKSWQLYRRISFNDKELRQETELGQTVYRPDLIHKVVYHNEAISLYTGNNQAIFLKKDWLKTGSWEDFTAYIKESWESKNNV